MGGTMPVWGAVTLAVVVALITQVGAVVLEHRRHKHEKKMGQIEEWHRNLRWAVDLLASGNLVLGIQALDALDDASFIEKENQ